MFYLIHIFSIFLFNISLIYHYYYFFILYIYATVVLFSNDIYNGIHFLLKAAQSELLYTVMLQIPKPYPLVYPGILGLVLIKFETPLIGLLKSAVKTHFNYEQEILEKRIQKNIITIQSLHLNTTTCTCTSI